MEKIKIESRLCSNGRSAPRRPPGYSSVEEFVAHCIENELKKHKMDEVERSGRGPAPRPGVHRVMDAAHAGRRLAQRRGQRAGQLAAGAHRRAAGLALRHGRRGGDRRAAAGRRSSTPPTSGPIKRVRDDINANLLALKLFKDSTQVTLRAQGRLLLGARPAVPPALVPMAGHDRAGDAAPGPAVAVVSAAAAAVGEEAVVTLQLNGGADDPFPDVSLRPDGRGGGDGRAGPRAQQAGECAGTSRPGKPAIIAWCFRWADQTVDKELAVGDGFMRVSTSGRAGSGRRP